MTAPRTELLILVALMLAGCGRSSSRTGELNPPSSGDPAITHAEAPVLNDYATLGPPEAEPHPAVLAVRVMLEALRDGRLEDAYDFLPERFQAEIDRLLQERTAEIEPELWQAVTRTAHKGLLVLREKKAFILESLTKSDREVAAESLAANWDDLIATLAELEASELARLETLRSIRVRDFLATTGNALFRGLRGVDVTPLDALLETRVTETTWPDGRVVLAITPPGQEHANLTEFMPVDDRWLPRPLIEAWPATLATWRTRLAVGDREAQQHARAAIAEFEASFDQMRSATTVEEFQAAAAPFLLKVYRTYHRWTQPAGPPGGVSITIRGRFNDDQQTRILAELESLSDEPPRCVYTATANPDAMVIALRPVADVDAFAARLTFGSDVEVDAESRTVTLTYRAP